MAFSTKKLGANDINGGTEFTNGQGLQPNDINSIVKGVLWLNENGGSGSSSGGGTKLYLHEFTIYAPNSEKIIEGFFYSTSDRTDIIDIRTPNAVITLENMLLITSPVNYSNKSGSFTATQNYDEGGYLLEDTVGELYRVIDKVSGV